MLFPLLPKTITGKGSTCARLLDERFLHFVAVCLYVQTEWSLKNSPLGKSALGALRRQFWGMIILQTEMVCGRERDLK